MNPSRFFCSSFFLFLFLFLNSAVAQTRFEEGYYIDKTGSREEALLETRKWTTWSNEFLTIKRNGEIRQIPIQELEEFGMEDRLKFVTAVVKLDRSPEGLRSMDTNPEPNFQEEEVLLNVLVEGELSLYLFLDNDVKKFFYKSGNEPIRQLIYKKYREVVEEKENVKENVAFRKQLKEIASCGAENSERIMYELGPLQKFFLKQNECRNSEPEFVAGKSTVRQRLGARISAGAMYSQVDIERAFNEFKLNTITPTFGVDVEYTIPTILHEVGLKISGVYNSFEVKDEIIFPYSSNTREVVVSHSEVIVGPSAEYRYFLNNHMFLSGGAGYYFPILLEESSYTESVSRLELNGRETKPFPGLFVSVGYNDVDLKFQTYFGSNVLSDINNFSVDVQRTSLSLGYSF